MRETGGLIVYTCSEDGAFDFFFSAQRLRGSIDCGFRSPEFGRVFSGSGI